MSTKPNVDTKKTERNRLEKMMHHLTKYGDKAVTVKRITSVLHDDVL